MKIIKENNLPKKIPFSEIKIGQIIGNSIDEEDVWMKIQVLRIGVTAYDCINLQTGKLGFGGSAPYYIFDGTLTLKVVS